MRPVAGKLRPMRGIFGQEEAYKSDLRTRLKPGGSVVLIMTRWHEDDLAGRILPENYDGESGWITARDGEKWYVLSLQAECERDDDPLGREAGELLSDQAGLDRVLRHIHSVELALDTD